MHIGLDFDDTITMDPELWLDIIRLFQQRGHQLSIVTVRVNNSLNDDIHAFAQKAQVPVFFSGGLQKASFMEKQGRPVDIWIDDAPVGIPAAPELFGSAIGCHRMGESIDPDGDKPAQLVFKTDNNHNEQ